MNDHYYTASPASEHRERRFTASAAGKTLTFATDAGVFSMNELDPGSRLLIETAPPLDGHVLDMGCGWGPVGLFLKSLNPSISLCMADINERALALAAKNAAANGVQAKTAQSDGLEQVEGPFDYILTNPPIRAGKQVIYRLFAESAQKLSPEGALYIVIRKQQGAESAVKYLKTIFQQVDTVDKSGGFWVIRCREGKQNEV